MSAVFTVHLSLQLSVFISLDGRKPCCHVWLGGSGMSTCTVAFWKNSFFRSSLGCNSFSLNFWVSLCPFFILKNYSFSQLHMYIKCTLIIILPLSFFILFSLSLNSFFIPTSSPPTLSFFICSLHLIRAACISRGEGLFTWARATY